MIGHKSLVSECYHILHIEDGYRYSHDFYEAFMSLFKMHNETMNIWSHLLGFVCVVIAGIITSIDLWQGAHQTQPMELIAFETYLVCAAFCLLMSSIYHWFCCISEDAHDWLLKLDLSGVGLLVSGSFLPGVYYGFYCTPEIQQLYMGMAAFILAVGLAAPWFDLKWKGRNLKPYVYALLVLFGLLPFNHWVLLTPPHHRDQLAMGFTLMFFWYGTGFTTYIVKVPEVFFPKSYLATHILPSHTIWHICVLNAVYVWFYFLMNYRKLIMTEGCSAYQRCELLNSCPDF